MRADTEVATDPSSAAATDAWTRRCQRQFDASATDRLTNLADEANLVSISPGDD
ncbi:MAG: hypothetical protein ABEI27_00615 [Halobellus sp.]|uniref:hypothetical protein n=1 Tax=Halobellus sp. TaxID=1979212 RepID=UPI0035D4166E